MSFAADTKVNFANKFARTDCCAKAECYGILLFVSQSSFHSEVLLSVPNIGNCFALGRFDYRTDTGGCRYLCKMTRRNGHPVTSTVTIPDETKDCGLLQYFGHTGNEVTLRINRDMIQWNVVYLHSCEEFLSCGTITNPEKRISFGICSALYEFSKRFEEFAYQYSRAGITAGCYQSER